MDSFLAQLLPSMENEVLLSQIVSGKSNGINDSTR